MVERRTFFIEDFEFECDVMLDSNGEISHVVLPSPFRAVQNKVDVEDGTLYTVRGSFGATDEIRDILLKLTKEKEQ